MNLVIIIWIILSIIILTFTIRENYLRWDCNDIMITSIIVIFSPIFWLVVFFLSIRKIITDIIKIKKLFEYNGFLLYEKSMGSSHSIEDIEEDLEKILCDTSYLWFLYPKKYTNESFKIQIKIYKIHHNLRNSYNFRIKILK